MIPESAWCSRGPVAVRTESHFRRNALIRRWEWQASVEQERGGEFTGLVCDALMVGSGHVGLHRAVGVGSKRV